MVSFSLVSAIGAVLVASVVAPLAFIVYLVARWQKLDKLAGSHAMWQCATTRGRCLVGQPLSYPSISLLLSTNNSSTN